MKPLPLSIVARASVKFQWMHCWRPAVYSVTSGRFSNLVNLRNAFWSHGMSDFGINSPYEVKPVFSRDISPPWSHLKQSNKKAAAPGEFVQSRFNTGWLPMGNYQLFMWVQCPYFLYFCSEHWTLLLTDGNRILPFDPLILILDWSCSMGANSVVGINRSCWSFKVCFMS